MSIKKFGGQTDDLQLQPGWTLDFPLEETIAGSAIFHCDQEIALNNPLSLGDPHPKDDRAKLSNFQIIGLTMNKVEIRCSYFGITTSPTRAIYSYYVGANEDPIESHPDFSSKIGGTKNNPLNGAIYNSEGEFVGFPADAGNNLAAVRGYLQGSILIRRTWYSNDVYEGLEDTYKRFSINNGVIPGVSQDTNALKTNWGSNEVSLGIYEVYDEYTLSGDNGWNPLIYKDQGSVG